MPEVPRISGAKAVKAFERAGFEVVRITGSHHIMKRAGHRHRLSIPVHAGKTVGVGLLKSQIAAVGSTVERFIENL